MRKTDIIFSANIEGINSWCGIAITKSAEHIEPVIQFIDSYVPSLHCSGLQLNNNLCSVTSIFFPNFIINMQVTKTNTTEGNHLLKTNKWTG